MVKKLVNAAVVALLALYDVMLVYIWYFLLFDREYLFSIVSVESYWAWLVVGWITPMCFSATVKVISGWYGLFRRIWRR